MNKKILFSIVVLTAIMILSVVVKLLPAVRDLPNKLGKGETHEALENTIFKDLSDSLQVQLEHYKAINGHYPIISTKFFLDSLSRFDFIAPVYIYQDSSRRYIGLGNKSNVVHYTSSNGSKFHLELIRNQ